MVTKTKKRHIKHDNVQTFILTSTLFQFSILKNKDK